MDEAVPEVRWMRATFSSMRSFRWAVVEAARLRSGDLSRSAPIAANLASATRFTSLSAEEASARSRRLEARSNREGLEGRPPLAMALLKLPERT